MNLGEICYELGDFRGATAAFEEVPHSQPEGDPCYCATNLWLGYCYRAVYLQDKARAHFERALTSSSPSTREKLSAQENLAQIEYEAREYKKAAERFRELLTLYSKDDPVRLNTILWLGHCYEGIRDYARAQDSYEEVLTASDASEGDKLSAQEGLQRLSGPAKQTYH